MKEIYQKISETQEVLKRLKRMIQENVDDLARSTPDFETIGQIQKDLVDGVDRLAKVLSNIMGVIEQLKGARIDTEDGGAKNFKWCTLDEDFTHSKPSGFMLQDKQVTHVRSWKDLYVIFLNQLKDYDAKLFLDLPDNPHFTTRHGNPYFSRSTEELRRHESVGDCIYAETNLSANNIVKRIRQLLTYFEIDKSKMRILVARNIRNHQG